MSNLETIENKISAIKKYLNILENYEDYSQQEIEDNIHLKGAVERYLYLVTQATIDLAESVISYKDLRKPTTMAKNFEVLREEKIISQNLAKKLSQMVGFRNIIAHDYEEVDYDVVYDILHQGLQDIKKFIDKIEEVK